MATHYTHIAVCIDGSAQASQALDEALNIAAASHGTIIALSVVEHRPQPIDPSLGFIAMPSLDAPEEAAAALLADARARCAARRVACIGRALDTHGADVASTLTQAAREHRADLMAIGTAGRHGMERLLLGSVAERVLRDAPCPVLAVRCAPARQVAGPSGQPGQI